jgi:beta-fructofuranosidase
MNESQPLDCPHILYVPPGAMSGTLGDSDIIAHDGKLHLFHLVLPNHSLIAHAISEDGFHWQATDPALHTGASGSFDDDMLWTMQVVRHPEQELFLMYYTGCSRQEHGQVQRIGLATSRDLIHWARHAPEPVLSITGPQYNSDVNRVGFVSCRDPYVFWDDKGGWHMLFTARTSEGNRFSSGCVGHASSSDGLAWTLQSPLFAPAEYEDLEVPSIIRSPNGWALFFNDFTRATTHCRIAPDLAGPWRRPKKSQPLPPGHFVWRFCQWRGRTLVWNSLRTTANWPMRYVPANSYFTLLAPGKELTWDDDEPVLRSWSEWESLASEGWEGCFESTDISLTSKERSGVFSEITYDHFIFEGEIDGSQSARLGILFRVDAAGEQFQAIELDPPRSRAELHQYQIHRPGVPRLKLKGPTLQQSAGYPAMLDRNVPFRLVVCGEYLEFSLDNRILLTHASYALKSGRLALFQIEGTAKFRNLRVCRLNPPWQEPVNS